MRFRLQCEMNRIPYRVEIENSWSRTLKKKQIPNLTFTGPCIVIYFYSKTNEMHQFLKFILFCSSTLHVSEVFPSIIRSLRLYIQHQVYVRIILLNLLVGTR
jgi:hypothetical protein